MLRTFSYLLIIMGFTLIFFGVIVNLVGTTKIGRLPGDILIKKENFTFYFPITTSILLSIFLSLFLTLVLRFFKK